MRLQRPVTFLFLLFWSVITRAVRMIWRFGGRWIVLSTYQNLLALRRLFGTSKISIILKPYSLALLALLLIVATSGTQALSAKEPLRGATPEAEQVVEERASVELTPITDSARFLAGHYIVSTTDGSETKNQQETVVRSALDGSTIVEPILSVTTSEQRLRDTIETYTVIEGDALSSIAEKFGLSLETVLVENKLRATSVIRPGDTLTILPVSGLSHTVQRNDTIGAIAKRYKVSEEEILNFNEIEDAKKISVGKKLIIPEGKLPPPPRPTRIVRQPSSPASSPTPVSNGSYFYWPTTGRRINQNFTWRHSGLDIDGDYTSSLFAGDDGVVVFSGWASGYGLSIVIDHGNGIKTRYAHASKLFAKVGQTVARGETIARMGSTGRSTGTHVHFEVLVNNRQVNPWPYLQ